MGVVGTLKHVHAIVLEKHHSALERPGDTDRCQLEERLESENAPPQASPLSLEDTLVGLGGGDMCDRSRLGLPRVYSCSYAYHESRYSVRPLSGPFGIPL